MTTPIAFIRDLFPHRPNVIKKDMDLPAAFDCKLDNETISLKTVAALTSIFNASLGELDLEEDRQRLIFELGTIDSAVQTMGDCQARTAMTGLIAIFNKRASDHPLGTAAVPPGPASSNPLESTAAGFDADIANTLSGGIYFGESTLAINAKSVSLLEAFEFKASQKTHARSTVSGTTLDKLDDIFRSTYGFLRSHRKEPVSLRDKDFGNPHRAGFRDLSQAADDLERIKGVLGAMQDSPARHELVKLHATFETVVAEATVYWMDQIVTFSEIDATPYAASPWKQHAALWLGWSENVFEREIRELRCQLNDESQSQTGTESRRSSSHSLESFEAHPNPDAGADVEVPSLDPEAYADLADRFQLELEAQYAQWKAIQQDKELRQQSF